MKKKQNLFMAVMCMIAAITAIVPFFYLLNFNIKGLLDSDMASEMILAKLLAGENKFLSRNWYYSTELRLFNTQILSSLLFRLTDNWNAVRMFTGVGLYIALLASYGFMMKALKVHPLIIGFTGFLVIIPFSWEVLYTVCIGLYYIPHYILCFLTLGSLFRSNESKKFFALTCFLAVLSGMGGIRYLVILWLPIVGVVFLRLCAQTDIIRFKISDLKEMESNKPTVNGIVGSMFAVGGYLFYTIVLSRIFHFFNYNTQRFIDFETTSLLERLNDCLTDILYMFGYKTGTMVSLTGMLNACVFLAVFMVIVFVGRRFKNSTAENSGKGFLVIFFISSFVINLFLFTTMEIYTKRYWLPVLVMVIPLLAIFLDELKAYRTLYLAVIFFAGYSILAAGAATIHADGVDRNTKRNGAIEFLKANNYHVGIATFWNANVVTELTNGEILMSSIGTPEDDHFYEWLTPTDFYQNERLREGKNFIMLERNEADGMEYDERYAESRIIYQDDFFIIYSADMDAFYN